MPSLYSRLFRNRERPDRSPLENFLTESLVDLLNRGGAPLTLGFIELCIQLGPLWTPAYRADLCDAIRAAGRVYWKTQIHAVANGNGGIADIVLCLDDTPRMVIESKIWAPIARHGDVDAVPEQGVVLAANQLHTYGCWLASQLPPPLNGVLVLLTHSYGQPPGFLDAGGQGYGIDRRAVARWQHVDRWLRAVAQQPGAGGCVTALARDLTAVLREKNIRGTIMTPTDLAAAHVFANSSANLMDLFKALRQQMKDTWAAQPLAPHKVIHGRPEVNLGGDPPIIWDWFYLNDSQQPGWASWFLAWGLLFSEGSDEGWALLSETVRQTVGELPAVFVVLWHEGHQNAAINITDEQVPNGWNLNRMHHFMVVCRPAHEFFGHNQPFNVEVANWMAARIPDLVPVLPHLQT